MSTATVAPILILARDDDPFACAVHRIATTRSIRIWQPADLGEIGWSVTLEKGSATVRLTDQAHGHSWDSGSLPGILFQTLPPLAAIETLDERDRTYVIAELRSSLAAVWAGAACPVIGMPRSESVEAALGPGPESRIALQQLGLPVATTVIGSSRIERLDHDGCAVRVTALHNGSSHWLEPAIANERHELDYSIAIASDGRTVHVIAIVGNDVRCLDVLDSGEIVAILPTDQDQQVAAAIRDATDLEVSVALCSRQRGTWRITRLSAQMPWWLADIEGIAEWFGSWLLDRFEQPRQQAKPLAGHAE